MLDTNRKSYDMQNSERLSDIEDDMNYLKVKVSEGDKNQSQLGYQNDMNYKKSLTELEERINEKWLTKNIEMEYKFQIIQNKMSQIDTRDAGLKTDFNTLWKLVNDQTLEITKTNLSISSIEDKLSRLDWEIKNRNFTTATQRTLSEDTQLKILGENLKSVKNRLLEQDLISKKLKILLKNKVTERRGFKATSRAIDTNLMRSIKGITWNPSTMHNDAYREFLKLKVETDKISIVFLLETKIQNEFEKLKWNGWTEYYSYSLTAGVAVLIRNLPGLVCEEVHVESNLIVLNLLVNGEKFKIVNIYKASTSEKMYEESIWNSIDLLVGDVNHHRRGFPAGSKFEDKMIFMGRA